MNTLVDRAYVDNMAPDALIIAAGSRPLVPPIPGLDGGNVVIVNNYYKEKAKVGDNVVILGGGLAGCECAIHLGQEGKKVHLVEMRDMLAPDANVRHRPLLLKEVEKYADVHPGLYLKILENGKYAAANDMVSIGIKAMKAIPKKYVIRSKAALKTAEYVIAADGEQSLLEKCYFAACESDTSAQNYLRALLNGYGNGKKREELQKLLASFPMYKSNNYLLDERSFRGYGGSEYFEREENKPNNNMILMLRFLDGQFAEVLDKGLHKSEALGWTGSFMKQGIALFLLCLYEGQWNGSGIAAMAEMAKSAMRFSTEEYRNGTCGLEGIGENDLFCHLFSQWKSIVPMSSDIRNQAIKRITVLLEKRTAGIMDANRRNYYGECAAYIAALGEVRESMGEMGAKQMLMTSYKDAYPRRSAFREEMRKYGWIDMKRK